MTRTAVVLFTRDLRVHDHPALWAACREAERVVPLFVLDDAILDRASPNRVAFLRASLEDLRASLVARGGSLVVRRGDLLGEVRQVCADVGATSLHVSADVSGYAQEREADLRGLAGELGAGFVTHPGVTVVPPGELAPSSGDHYEVFGAYWRRWRDHPRREVLPAPERVDLPAGLATGRIPALADLTTGEPSPRLPVGGETAGRERLDAWLADGIARYDDLRDDLGADATSRLSPHLHLGTVSPSEVASRIDLRRRGHEAFLRQLCWRDHAQQLLAARPDLPSQELRPRGDGWRDDPVSVAAWKAGRTGYPVVDAGMRQLLAEGFVHNRARMLVASFLTKQMYVDWRVGAAHFDRWLVDGDVASNTSQWQWVAGTGTDSRPNRVLNPWLQSRRYHAAAYIRRWVPELAHLDDAAIHEPHAAGVADAGGYPRPIVDHDDARTRFLQARGRR